DHQEFKSELFSTQAFTEMMIELDTAGDKRTLIVPTSANSMHELMNAGANYLTKSDLSIIGKESWKDLVPGSSLQKNCWNGGINMGKDLDRAWIRIGLVTDNSPENTGGICPTPNSYIGIGGKNDEIPTLDLSVGNYGKGHGNYEDGEKSIASFGYVFIR
ncbi:MAG: hypothetical protein GY828_05260, partial [Candidatus Gracilibacteria bacterium]|nr:hypothetical protein [Candidatus Gracilibacteria bacterium]